MEQFVDDSFIVVGNTLLAYTCDHVTSRNTLRVPGRFADIEITRIGDSSFAHTRHLKCVILPPSIKEISSVAFADCPALTSVFVPGGLSKIERSAFLLSENLRNITIYGLELTASEYHTLKDSGVPLGEGLYVLQEVPKSELVRQVFTALFFSTDISLKDTEEYSAFFAKMRKREMEIGFGNLAQQIKLGLRFNQGLLRPNSLLIAFDDNRTKEDQGKYIIDLTLRTGHFSWQTTKTINYWP